MRQPVGKTLTTVLCGLSLALSLLFSHATEVRAQDAADDDGPQEEEARTLRPRVPRRAAANLLAQLNLSPEQRAQLVEIRRMSAPEGQALMQRLNRARRALDAAIYADQTDEAVIEERTREVAEAQAAVVRMRALTELRVRRVLTPAQLEVFRQLRRQARRSQRLERRAGRRGKRAIGDK